MICDYKLLKAGWYDLLQRYDLCYCLWKSSYCSDEKEDQEFANHYWEEFSAYEKMAGFLGVDLRACYLSWIADREQDEQEEE